MNNLHSHAYVVGGGIAGLATAVLLIRDAKFEPQHIHLFEARTVMGGSLDAAGNPDDGYVVRGGRMFEAHFGCTFDLLNDIPTLHDPHISVTEDIQSFTQEIVTSSRSRLVAHGERQDGPDYELSLRDKWNLLRLSQLGEEALQGLNIENYFHPRFFQTAFWVMWSTMFAFKPCHSVVEMRRYMRRFMHLLPGFNRLEGIHRTRLNQFDSIVRPIEHWLRNQGVHIHTDCSVRDISFDARGQQVRGINFALNTRRESIQVSGADRVFITLGSMTDDSVLGSMQHPPDIADAHADHAGAWSLWRQIASHSPKFGRPDVFAGDTTCTQWLSFTVTMPHGKFFDHMQRFTHNVAGSGGLVTFRHSGWLMSVVLAHQPHFSDQPDHVHTFWGYGLHPERSGDHIRKPMLESSGAEILDELAFHLRLGEEADALLRDANCIPCLMPNITTQFMPRKMNDRPAVIPDGAQNFAFTGQFVELPEDTVFTVEYSIRSAQTAVYGLCATDKTPTPLYRGFEKPSVVRRALRCILNNGP